ncbi:MAG TPA: hypothetical protein VNM66_03815, partial [Thermodesulfobacteriota bacterium]|nr:hypothetical protein [Thermodesulfobacteriota bacterium]
MGDAAAILARVIEVSNSTADIERRLERIVGLAAAELGLDAAALFALDAAKESLSLRLAAGLPAPTPPLRIPVAEGAGRPATLLAAAVARREPIAVAD